MNASLASLGALIDQGTPELNNNGMSDAGSGMDGDAEVKTPV